MKKKIKPYSLYLVLSSEYLPEKNDPISVAAEAIEAGVDLIQVREKNLSRSELIGVCREIRSICSKTGTILIVNDDPYLAVEVGADGVHMGQSDILKTPLAKTRSIIGEEMIIGVSTHSLNEYRNFLNSEADYLAYGPIFPTKTKSYCIGLSDVLEVARENVKPTVFIGGIDLENVDELIKRGANIVAAIRSIVRSEDVAGTVKAFKEKLRRQSCA